MPRCLGLEIVPQTESLRDSAAVQPTPQKTLENQLLSSSFFFGLGTMLTQAESRRIAKLAINNATGKLGHQRIPADSSSKPFF